MMPSAEPLPGEHEPIAGASVWRVIAGPDAAPPLLLLHGIPTSSYLWRNVQRALMPGYRTIAPDLLGLGNSTPAADGEVRLERQADMLRALLDAHAVDRVVVVAHDIGGAVAHHFVAHHHDRVRALVVMNIAAFAASWPVPVVRAMRVPVLGDIASLVPSTPLLRRELRRGVHHRDRMAGAVFDAYAAPVSGLAGRRRFLRFIRGMDPVSAERALHDQLELDVPRLILWGEEDPYQPIEWGRRLHDLWKGSTFVQIAEAGHFLQEDQPARIAGEIEAFLAAHGIGQPAAYASRQ
jgi:pimeloyl-ACP methyl ester carboxylesterase